MRKELTWWQAWGLVLCFFALMGLVGAQERADHDRLEAAKRERPKVPAKIYTAEAVR